MWFKLHGRVIIMGHMYMSCYVTVIHLLIVLELRRSIQIPESIIYRKALLITKKSTKKNMCKVMSL